MKNKKLLLIVIVSVLFLASAIASYAYFSATLRNENGPNSIITQMGTLTLNFADNNNNISMLRAKPGDYIEKDFVVDNIGSLDAGYNIGWQQLTNTIERGELVIELTCESYSEYVSAGSSSNVLGGTCSDGTYTIGSSTAAPIATMIGIPANYTHVYHAIIRFIETNEVQNYNQGKEFHGVLEIQPENDVTNIQGILVDNAGNTIANATINTHSNPITTTTDSNGYYMLEGIDYGSHNIEVRDSSNNVIATDTFLLEKTAGTSKVINDKEVYYNKNENNVRKMLINLDATPAIDSITFSNYMPTSERCFRLSDETASQLAEYYTNENNDESEPLCPNNVVIPETINGTTITSIGEDAFLGREIRSVVIPNTVTSIGYRSFSYSYDSDERGKLKTVILGDHVQSIDTEAFTNNLISEIHIPSTVTSIGYSAFGSNYIKKIDIPSSISEISSFAFATNELIEINLPSSLTAIYEYAFGDNKLESVTLPNSLTTVDSYAFYENNISELSINSALTTIGTSAFAKNKLTSVTIPGTITTITSSAFESNLLNEVNIGYGVIEIEDFVFYNNKLSSIDLPNTITDIGDYAFAINELSNINFSNTIANIGEQAFANNKLSNISLPNSVAQINDFAFKSNLLESVSFPSNISSVGNGAFNDNLFPNETAIMYAGTGETGSSNIDYSKIVGYAGRKRDNIVLPSEKNGVPLSTIGVDAFSYANINSITLPNTVTNIENYAFSNNNLSNIDVPQSVTTLGIGVFSHNNISTFTLPTSFTEIPNSTFIYNNISSLDLPANITAIGNRAFQLNNLSMLEIPTTIRSIGEAAFGSNSMNTLVLNEGVTNISEDAFIFNDLTTVTIPASVTSIGGSAFLYNSFTHVNIKTKPNVYAFSVYGERTNSPFLSSAATNIFGWDPGVTCVKNNTSNVTNGCITWGVS